MKSHFWEKKKIYKNASWHQNKVFCIYNFEQIIIYSAQKKNCAEIIFTQKLLESFTIAKKWQVTHSFKHMTLK